MQNLPTHFLKSQKLCPIVVLKGVDHRMGGGESL